MEVLIASTTLLILLICSALVSGSEVAFFSLTYSDKVSLDSSEKKSAKFAKKLIDNPKKLLATILILNNFINIAIVIISSFLLLEIYPIDPNKPDLFRTLLEIIGITFIILLIGEIIPKIYANRNSLKISFLMSLPIYFIGKIPPFSWLNAILVNGTDVILKYARKKSINISSNDLENAIAITRDENNQEDDDKILEGIVNLGNKDVKQIMRPRTDTISINITENFNGLLALIKESGYSRIPVYEEKFDNIKGVLYIKDLLPHLGENEHFNWQELIRSPFFVPENKKIDDLLNEFKSLKMHMAIVVDEYGGANGIITLEDVLEEIVGEITDEFDEEEITYSKVNDHTFIFEGKTPLIDLYKVLEIDGKDFENAKGESDSIAGFLSEQCGKILRNNENFTFNNIKFIVESSDKRKVKSVKIIKLSDETNS